MVWRVAFSPNSQLLASGSGDTTVNLWTRQGTLAQTLRGHQAAVWGIAFTPDNRLIATSSIDATIKLWTMEGQLFKTLEGHQAGVRALVFHPDRPLLASAGDDHTIKLWNVDKILQSDPMEYGCAWVRAYLQTNANAEEFSTICQYE